MNVIDVRKWNLLTDVKKWDKFCKKIDHNMGGHTPTRFPCLVRAHPDWNGPDCTMYIEVLEDYQLVAQLLGSVLREPQFTDQILRLLTEYDDAKQQLVEVEELNPLEIQILKTLYGKLTIRIYWDIYKGISYSALHKSIIDAGLATLTGAKNELKVAIKKLEEKKLLYQSWSKYYPTDIGIVVARTYT